MTGGCETQSELQFKSRVAHTWVAAYETKKYTSGSVCIQFFSLRKDLLEWTEVRQHHSAGGGTSDITGSQRGPWIMIFLDETDLKLNNLARTCSYVFKSVLFLLGTCYRFWLLYYGWQLVTRETARYHTQTCSSFFTRTRDRDILTYV